MHIVSPYIEETVIIGGVRRKRFLKRKHRQIFERKRLERIHAGT